MPQFFIRRPVFAWVIALFIILLGAIAIPKLPIARYPSVAPPTVNLSATYPGATPQTMNDGVISLIERELSSVKNLLYFESSSDTSGSASIVATFKPGTDPAMAQVDVQNKLKAIEPRLPQVVRQNGLTVESASSGFLMIIGLQSDDGRFDETALSDYMARNVVEELRRIEGVGRVQLFGAEQAMRIWVDPAKLIAYGLSMNDLSAAISQQNAQIAPGSVGASPALPAQRVTVPLTVQGQLTTPEQFAAIVLRANANGSKVVMGDVARVELGAQSYGFINRENGKAATAAAVQLAPGANAVRTAEGVQARMAELSRTMPAGMSYSIPFNTAPFVKISIEKVIQTLIEAMVLVFLVMYLFLQNVRYTLIPAIVAPIALLGTFTIMLASGFSINVLTMFGMVLAIGIIVDDAIVVVENVERLMAQEGLSPRDATIKAMKEITGAVIGITLVLTAVFIPMALASGSVGVIYQQFTLSMAVSIVFSALLALTLTPALCATLLKPVDPAHHEKRGVFGWFNRRFDRITQGYAARVGKLVTRTGRVMLVFGAIAAVLALAFRQLPSSFLPEEDQGYFMTTFQLPADATAERTLDVVKAFEQHVASRASIQSNMSIVGFGFSGSGSNAAMAFTMLKDWDARNGATAQNEMRLAQQAMAGATEGTVMSLLPPAIDELGTSSGFTLRLQDRANQGDAALKAAETKLLELAAQSRIVSGVYPDGLPAGTSIRLDIDRQKAEALGVAFTSISETLSTAIGSLYVNDFPNAGRMQQVIIQADAPARMQIDDVLKLYVRNAGGGMVPLSEVVRPVWSETPLQLVRFQGFPAARISGNAAPGASSGAAMAEMERLAAQLPPGFAIAWTGQSLQERQSAAQAPMLMALSMLVVFLVLAALYESWAIPLSVMLVVPLGLLGAVLAVLLRGMPNDVFFKVGMITVIGLSAKNAILIVEFAKQLREQGKGLVESAVTAARLRLRPILMTSLAFGLGVVPLMIAMGASAETQHAIGTGVFGGMVSATVLAIFFVPVFFVFVMGLQERFEAWRASRQAPPPPVSHQPQEG
ncbi:multidrug efflux RND transporter permease subunit [Ralstonia pseudosolanacearum]|uniref:multidrug efflux RND transporter permease subunit n=1 Tax=Ralstonia pseudosolanacearum TaxID=1310165 RepID=UPI000DACAEB4|nr:multidrug efflux RND transporter permease subunit [Ralstonia pseudosolanacearum]AZU58704.1 multidrug efflux RND transporter permease subunit [Ralstonia solanacearum]MCK4137063.1 multidrug efflux RND transporter permease subunit [Ralstonia pseudosolanacearum]MCK4141221.1 multidrug efflux RND transporter permease subunit [Ralstonia pseudosolanacearum]RAA13087.1 multidrug efflux RND transporter permease subunit [Ralstonia pseudosolanacearum]UQY84616.1 multidrug efflux RND transporter permease 